MIIILSIIMAFFCLLCYGIQFSCMVVDADGGGVKLSVPRKVFLLSFIPFYGVYYFIFYKPLDQETLKRLEAIKITNGIPFSDLPKHLNHENSLVKTFILERLKGTL